MEMVAFYIINLLEDIRISIGHDSLSFNLATSRSLPINRYWLCFFVSLMETVLCKFIHIYIFLGKFIYIFSWFRAKIKWQTIWAILESIIASVSSQFILELSCKIEDHTCITGDIFLQWFGMNGMSAILQILRYGF